MSREWQCAPIDHARGAWSCAAGPRILSFCAIATLAFIGVNPVAATSNHFAAQSRACQLFSLPAGSEAKPAGENQKSAKTHHSRVKPATDAKAVEMEFWRSVSNLATIEAYQSYLDQYPDGAFKSLAQAEIARLQDLASAQKAATEQAREKEQADERARQEAADDGAFQTAKALNTKEGYDTYISAYPSGRHASEAQDAERSLSSFAGAWCMTQVASGFLSHVEMHFIWKLSVDGNDVDAHWQGTNDQANGHGQIEGDQVTLEFGGARFTGRLVSATRLEGRWTLSNSDSGDWYAGKPENGMCPVSHL